MKSALAVYHESSPEHFILQTSDTEIIAKELHKIGISFQQCATHSHIHEKSTTEEVALVYQDTIETLRTQSGFQSWDVIALHANHPDKHTLRQKFLSEHSHGEDEVRFFVSGKGLFNVHSKSHVYSILCVKGDFISVPAKALHWFDMGSEPHFIAIRFFNNPEGWIATYTDNDIATRFPTIDHF